MATEDITYGDIMLLFPQSAMQPGKHTKPLMKSVNFIYKNIGRINDKLQKSSDDVVVDFIIQYLEKNNKLPDMSSVEMKNNVHAEKYRKDGNEKYIKDELLEALKLYTKSIAHAENNSSTLAQAYANRSAVLFRKKYYAECLVDIERALDNNYPEDLKHKLTQRKKDTLTSLKQQKPVKFHENLPEITKYNSKIQCAANCVEIREDEYFGRSIIATKDIKIGELIAVEKPYVAVVAAPNHEFINCHECLELCYNLFPCKNCKTALYCSEACALNAFNTYHKLECEIIQHNVDTYLLPIKMTLKSYQECINGHDDKDERYCSGRYKEISQFKLPVLTSFKLPATITIALCYYLIKKCLNLSQSEALIVKKIMMHIFYVKLVITRPIAMKQMDTMNHFAAAMYPFLSLLNHSCNPNVIVVHYGAYGIARATRTIKKGQQLFVSYCERYFDATKEVRKLRLKTTYNFDCNCEACVNDWPLSPEVKQADEFSCLYIYCRMVLKKITKKYVPSKVDKRLKEITRLLSNSEKYEPCQEMLLIISLLFNIFQLAGNREIPF